LVVKQQLETSAAAVGVSLHATRGDVVSLPETLGGVVKRG
jgi:hypothetical protein